MIDTSKCETKEELEEAMRYEDLKLERRKVTDDIFTYTTEIGDIELLLSRLYVKLENIDKELEKYKDKPYVIHTE